MKTAHLPQLEQHVAAAGARAARPGRRRFRVGRPAALGLLGAVAIGGAASAVVLDGATVDPTITAKLSVLQRPAVPEDDSGEIGRRLEQLQQRKATAQAANPHPEPVETLNFRASRRVRTQVAELNLWLVPSADDGSACLISQADNAEIGQEGPCLRRDQLTTGSTAQTFTAAGHTDVLGIVPDAVTNVTVHLADGEAVAVDVIDNVYAARFTKRTRSVSYPTPDGAITRAAPGGG